LDQGIIFISLLLQKKAGATAKMTLMMRMKKKALMSVSLKKLSVLTTRK
jgi:hypothetical protein